jgi:hypothetical protein
MQKYIISKTKACKQAASEISELYRFGGQWRYSYYDHSCEANRESTPRDYYSAQFSRRCALISRAMELLHPDRVDSHAYEPGDFSGGAWHSYVQ